MSDTILRWNNLSHRFDPISVDALNGKVHDIGNAHPTRLMPPPMLAAKREKSRK